MKLLQKIKRRLQPIAGGIDQTWSHDGCIGIRGWVVHRKGDLEKAEVEVDGVRVAVKNWHPRPDVGRLFPGLSERALARCGFWVMVPRQARHTITLYGTDGSEAGSLTWNVKGAARPLEDAAGGRARRLFRNFVDRVNREHLHVLEVGSRVVAPDSVSKRGLFNGAASYTGFDYYPDANTDVVGDAHRLGDFFSGRKFDAVFSYSVLEHLAMPWVFALEVNRVLNTGGWTFHHTHFAWPQHEQPWDFWRFTDEALKVLFSRPTGFEVAEAGMFEPLHMYLDHAPEGMETFPEFPAYGGSVVLARKVAEPGVDRGVWDVGVDDVCGGAYPPPGEKRT